LEGYSITTPEDELTDLIKRLVILNNNLKAQIEALSQQASKGKGESEFLQNNQNMAKNLFKAIRKDEDTPPAYVKSLSVNYGDRSRWTSADPLASENEKWVATPPINKEKDTAKNNCANCRYKEGLEEVLNILSVCGFIKKPVSTEIEVTDISKEQENQRMHVEPQSEENDSPSDQQQRKNSSRDMRIKFKGKNGSEREFYY